MATWVKNLVMIVVSIGWVAFVVVAVAHGQIPPVFVWAVPGATYAALAGKLPGGKRVKVLVEDIEPPPPPPVPREVET